MFSLLRVLRNILLTAGWLYLVCFVATTEILVATTISDAARASILVTPRVCCAACGSGASLDFVEGDWLHVVEGIFLHFEFFHLNWILR